MSASTRASAPAPADDPALDTAGARLLADERLAACFKAFAHPARLAILRALADRERCCCGDIVGMLPLAQSTVSQHLQILRDAGLIRGEIEGRRSCYWLDGEAVAAFAGRATALTDLLAEANGKCALGIDAVSAEPRCAKEETTR